MDRSSKAGSIKRQLLLTAIAVCSIVLFYSVGINRAWFNAHVVDFWQRDLYTQLTSEESEVQKKEHRYGPSYFICHSMADYFKTSKRGEVPIVLLEPNEYLMEKVGFKMPEPLICYYFTEGIKCVWTNSPEAAKANNILYITTNRFKIRHIDSAAMLQAFLNKYGAYKNIL